MNKCLNGLVAMAAVTAIATSVTESIAYAEQTQSEVADLINSNLQGFTPTNDTTETTLTEAATKGVVDPSIEVESSYFYLNKATKLYEGYISANFTINKLITTGPAIGQTTGPAAYAYYNDEISVPDPLLKANYVVVDIIDSLDLSNSTTQAAVVASVNQGLTRLGVTSTLDSFVLTPATSSSIGNLYTQFTLSKDGKTDIVKYKAYFGLDNNDQTAAELKERLEDDLPYIEADNYWDDYELLKNLNENIENIENSNLSLRIDNYAKTDATNDAKGSMTGTIVILDGSAEASKIPFNIELLSNDDATLRNIASDLGNIEGSNSVTASQIKANVEAGIDDSSITVTVSDLNLEAATDAEWGYLECKITLTKANGLVITCYGNIDIYPLSCSNTTASSSSSSSSSSHSSSSSSSSSSTTTSTSTATTNTTSTTATTSTSLIKVASPEAAKEVAKVATQKVVTILGTTLGDGVTASSTKDITTADGNQITLTKITNNGKYAGAIVIAAKDSPLSTIPVDKDGGQVTAVYKFVPLLNKYIQVTNGVAIGTDAITLSTQANAVYYAATVPMTTAETVAPGWAKVNAGWYMLNATGDIQTGWQKDSTGSWSYLSPENGVMQTGWLKQGNTWYNLKTNGYMATGWIQDGNQWYYCNTDGSMASNTTVDGYVLGSNGAWVR